MAQKLIVSVGAVVAMLIAVPTVLAALRPASPFTERPVLVRGWSTGGAGGPLKIGESVNETLTAENAGPTPASVTLGARITGDASFARHLWVVATRAGGRGVLFSGPVPQLRSLRLGRLPSGGREAIRVRISLVAGRGGDNALQGRRASVDFILGGAAG